MLLGQIELFYVPLLILIHDLVPALKLLCVLHSFLFILCSKNKLSTLINFHSFR